MSGRDAIIWTLYKTLPKKGLLHQLVRHIYRNVLIPTLSLILKTRHRILKKIIIRNSSQLNDSFNAFLSDIDITLIVTEPDHSTELISDYLLFKKILPMLDYPEIYSEVEFQKLHNISSCSKELIDFCWHIRKINWSLQEQRLSSSTMTKFKKDRAIKKSFKILGLDPEAKKMEFNLSHFPVLRKYLSINSDINPELCYYSQYLETTRGDRLTLMMNREQFKIFNSLMPGEIAGPGQLKAELQEAKKEIEFHELYLSKSAMRVRSVQKLDVTPWIIWTNNLERKLGISK